MIGQVYKEELTMDDEEGNAKVQLNIEITVDHNKTLTVDDISDFVNYVAQELDLTLKGIIE